MGHVKLGQLKICFMSFFCSEIDIKSSQSLFYQASYLLLFSPGYKLTDRGAVPGWEDEGRLAVTPETDPGHGSLMRPPGEHQLTRGAPQAHLAVVMTKNNAF